jgi:hypothetical protein
VFDCAVQEVNEAFDELEEGNEEALKTEYDRQVHRCSHNSLQATASMLLLCCYYFGAEVVTGRPGSQ